MLPAGPYKNCKQWFFKSFTARRPLQGKRRVFKVLAARRAVQPANDDFLNCCSSQGSTQKQQTVICQLFSPSAGPYKIRYLWFSKHFNFWSRLGCLTERRRAQIGFKTWFALDLGVQGPPVNGWLILFAVLCDACRRYVCLCVCLLWCVSYPECIVWSTIRWWIRFRNLFEFNLGCLLPS